MADFLLDTNAISLFAPSRTGKRQAPTGFSGWVVENHARLYLSVITIFELEAGLQKLGRASPGRFHAAMGKWVTELSEQFASQILLFDAAAARIAGSLSEQNAAGGRNPGAPDLLIGATALRHEMTLVTRNQRDFALGGFTLLDPFKDFPE